MQINTVKGILFPDIISDMLSFEIYNSMSDLLDKLTRVENNVSQSGQQIFRDIRKKDKNRFESKKLIKDMSERFPSKFIPKLSDIRNMGNWWVLKSMYEEYKSDESNRHMWILSDYILNICEEEKQNIENLRKSNNSIQLIKTFKEQLFLAPSICEKAINSFPGENCTEEQRNKWSEDNKELTASVIVHQYLHLAAILEQDIYTFYRKSCTKEQLEERKMISRLLPTIDSNEKYCSAREKLLTHIIEGSGFPSRNKFIEYLCKEEPENIERKTQQFKRLKRGNTPLTSASLNTLLVGDKDAMGPSGIVIACRICDEISKDLIKSGFSEKWIVDQYSNYEKYQKKIIRQLRASSL